MLDGITLGSDAKIFLLYLLGSFLLSLSLKWRGGGRLMQLRLRWLPVATQRRRYGLAAAAAVTFAFMLEQFSLQNIPPMWWVLVVVSVVGVCALTAVHIFRNPAHAAYKCPGKRTFVLTEHVRQKERNYHYRVVTFAIGESLYREFRRAKART